MSESDAINCSVAEGARRADETSVQSAVIVQLLKEMKEAYESSYATHLQSTRTYSSKQYWLGVARGYAEATYMLEELLNDAAPSRIEGDPAAD